MPSQRHEGWALAPDPDDDGGLWGGSMERPVLRRLLTDVEAREVDTIVVHETAIMPAVLRRGMLTGWCGQEDSNFHGLSATTTSTLRVYQFRHGRTTILPGRRRPSVR